MKKKKNEDVIEEVDITLEKNEREDEVNEFRSLTNKIQELEDKNVRIQSEFQNYKRRTEEERMQYIANANIDLISQILPILDDFERAMLSAKDEQFKKYLEGFNLIHDNMLNTLKKDGLEEIEALDKVFDPNSHQAVATEKVSKKENDIILEVFQKGYKLNGKIIRPAMVKVNKGEM